MANSSLQVLKIVKSGYVLFLCTPPLFFIHCDWWRKQEERKSKREKNGKKERKKRRANTRSGISKPVEFDPS
jgi:hypothetical protein